MIGRLSRSDSASAPGLSTSRRNPLGSDFAEIFNPREWIAGIRWFHLSHGGLFGVNDRPLLFSSSPGRTVVA